MAPTDLVYLVRPGDDNEELRFSLRSVAANVPHRKVFIFGHCPPWVDGVEVVELPPLGDKYDNQFQSLTAACAHDGVSDPFILMNDDFFAMKSVREVPILHGLSVQEHHDWFVGKGKSPDAPYLVAMRNTLEQLHGWGYSNPLTYELHSPLPMPKARLAAMLAVANKPFLWQAAYAAITDRVGRFGFDAKNATAQLSKNELALFLQHSPFLSSYDASFKGGTVGEFVRAAFPNKCRYER